MLQKSLFFMVFLCFLAAQSFAAAKFPFPQDQTYPTAGVIKPTNADHTAVQEAYKVFLNNFYVESGDQARIKWDKPAQTVSEGIGYGMLIMVYMDNDSNQTQAKFDKLWNYYKAHLDSYGLMNWQINDFTNVTPGTNSATDGDIDVAFALALASYQWGGNYKVDAQALLAKIYANDVQGNVLCGGDNYKNVYNPSYFIFAALDLFKTFDPSHGWAAVASGCYALMQSSQNATTGLIPDWCSSTGGPGGPSSNYSFDAARCPWRLASAYCWYGDAAAKTMADKMTTWLKGATGGDPSKIKDGYQLNGTPTDTFNIPAYIGPFTCAAMTGGSGNQAWLDACYNRLSSFIDNSNYYNQCLQVMSMLLLTGNFLDFSTATPKTAFKITTGVSPASAGSVTVSPVKATYAKGDQVTITAVPTGANKFVKWGGDLNSSVSPATFTISYDMNITGYFNAGAGDLIDDCEDGNGVTNLGGKWFTYNDSTDKGLSTVTPKTTPTTLFTMTDGGANGSLKAAKVSYTLNKGSNPYNPYAGFGFWLKKQSATDTVLDISAASGLTFYFKGDSCDVRVETTNITDFAYFKVRLPKAADWTLVTLQWSSFKQASWTTAPKTFDRTKATKIAWQSPDNFATGQSGVIWVDDIHLPGFVVPTETKQTARAAMLKQGISIASDNAKSMTIRYSLASAGPVEITLFDLSGKIAHRLFSGQRQSGFNTQNVGLPGAMPRGTYLVQVKSGSNVYSDKISFVK